MRSKKVFKSSEALECLNKALKLNPSLIEAIYNKGIVLDQLGRYEEAIVAFEAAIKNNPDCESAFHAKAIVLNHLGKHTEAFDTLMEAYMLSKKNQE